MKVEPKLEVRTRIRVLFSVVDEIARGFGASDITLQTLKKGILDRQLLTKIDLSYLTANDRIVGRVELSIDWEKHGLLARSDQGATLRLEGRGSIADQLSKIYSILVAHCERLRKAYGVTKVDSLYVFREEIYRDPAKLAEARAFLGTSPTRKEHYWVEGQPGSEGRIAFRSDRLKELSLKIEHVKPKS